MTQQELDALRALADAATPGPWLTNGWYDGIRYSVLFSANERFTETLAYNLNCEDAAFIAATRAAVPALIAEVERLNGERSFLMAEIKKQDAEMERLRAEVAGFIAAELRKERIEALYGAFGADETTWPDSAKARLAGLREDQSRYEARYT